MNTKTFPIVITIISMLAVLLSACAPAVTPTQAPIAAAPQEAPKQPAAQQPSTKINPPAPTFAPRAAEATRAPAAPQLPAAPPPADNYFQNYGVNPFVDTIEDHLSTFGLDVDTASYTIARRYVMDGNLPPADSVRVEEFVNYFHQGYPTPSDVAFGIYADGAPSPFHYDGTYILRFGVQGYQIPESERKPASLTFVIDTSGSMSMENRLMLVKQSLQLLVDRLRPTDTVAIIQYGSDARVVLNPTSGEDRATILDAIYSLETSGATNAEAGLRLGYQLANQAFRPGAINRVILCSDGVANVGATGPDQILESIRGYAASGMTLTTVGFGMGNFNDVLMEKLADGGDGNYAYVDDLDEARRLFVDNLTSTLETIALNAKVQVDFNPDVVARYRLIGYENRAIADENFRNDSVEAGEIGAGHSATALYAVQLKPNATGRIATVQLRWEDPQAHTIQEINGNFNTWDLALSFDSASARYQLATVVAQYAEVLRRSPWADGTTINQILDHAVRLTGVLPEDPQVAELASLVSRATQIEALMH
jgi:Ca-activated chloride channel family protein